jgi:hypothetical protein
MADAAAVGTAIAASATSRRSLGAPPLKLALAKRWATHPRGLVKIVQWILRSAFMKSVIEGNIPEDKWRSVAALLISDFTGSDDVDSDLLEWIVRK